MSAGRWIRLYEHVLNHPKVQHLDGESFKVWVNLLCLNSQCGGQLPPSKHIGWALRMSELDVQRCVDALLAARLVDVVEGGIAIHDWDDWQYFGCETST